MSNKGGEHYVVKNMGNLNAFEKIQEMKQFHYDIQQALAKQAARRLTLMAKAGKTVTIYGIKRGEDGK